MASEIITTALITSALTLIGLSLGFGLLKAQGE